MASDSAAVDTHERRDPKRQQPIPGGARRTDPPLRTRDCADWMGVTPEFVRGAITRGVTRHGVIVKLEAETLCLNSRRTHRIHLDRFVEFLRAVGWKRLPKLPPSYHDRTPSENNAG